ncbi:MAG: MgtC/SapB family protein [Candidatus Uhrbacteria bacterium]
MSIFTIGDSEILLRLIMAAILCGMIGFEYKSRNRTAQIRTSALIGMGVALFTIASIGFVQLGAEGVVDASQIAGFVLAGVGLICLGVIMQSRGIVKGLTTAASIWIVAAIGMVIGMGMYGAAVIATILTIIILTILRNINAEEDDITKVNLPR